MPGLGQGGEVMMELDLSEDGHVHTNYFVGLGDIERTIAAACRSGLLSITCVESASSTATWISDFVELLAQQRERSNIALLAAVEVCMSDSRGALDLPMHLPAGLGEVLVSDDLLPLHGQLIGSADVHAGLRDGVWTPAEVTESLVSSYIAVMLRNRKSKIHLTFAHPFKILERAGISDAYLSDEQIDRLCDVATHTRSSFEISERWTCPSISICRRLAERGVSLKAGSDAYTNRRVGSYRFVRRVAELIAA
jgi:histidinol phosphatase-like PHP family hydrolase